MPKPNHKQKLLDVGLAVFIAAAITRAGELILSRGCRTLERKHAQTTDQDQQTCDGRSRNASAGRHTDRWIVDLNERSHSESHCLSCE
jgi:hypothetical protein